MNRALAALPDMSSATDFSASAAKAKLGEVIDLVAAGGIATITRRGRQRFAVLKLETLEALVATAKEQELEALGDRYDALVARMQTPAARSAADALFTATGDEIGAAATGRTATGRTATGRTATERTAADGMAEGAAATGHEMSAAATGRIAAERTATERATAKSNVATSKPRTRKPSAAR